MGTIFTVRSVVVLTGLQFSSSSALLSGYEMFQAYLYFPVLAHVIFFVQWS